MINSVDKRSLSTDESLRRSKMIEVKEASWPSGYLAGDLVAKD